MLHRQYRALRVNLFVVILFLFIVIYIVGIDQKAIGKGKKILFGDLDTESEQRLLAMSAGILRPFDQKAIENETHFLLSGSGTHSEKRLSTVLASTTKPFNYKTAMDLLNRRKVEQNDTELITLIREYYIEPPSSLPYNLTNPGRLDSSEGQVSAVDSILNHQENGFFIDCGAYTGEFKSNTLLLEKMRHWSGLLIEANPLNYAKLQTKHRKAYSINACLNTKPYPAMMTFNQFDEQGRVIHDDVEVRQWIRQNGIKTNETQVQCFPLYSILLALNTTTVDYFSLDIEGDELYVLQTLPFEKVDIKVLSVEYWHIKGGKSMLESFLYKKGYEVARELRYDIIFKKKTRLQV